MKKREKGTAGIQLFYQELRIVKLTFLFILLACLQVSAKTYSQDKITVNLQSADLKKALTVIERKSDYHFLYNEAIIANKPKIDLNVKDAEITSVLDKILVANGINYRILNNNLVVLKADADKNKIEIPDIRVSGKVTGLNGTPLSGVSVTIKGANTGTTTDDAGNYSIAVPNENAVLVFSYVGYTTQEVTVGNRSTINISLLASANQLDQVVVVGYGTQRKIDVTGSVTQVKGEEVSKQPVFNPVSALQGKVAGVQITNNGAPGSSPQIRIRGVGTVYGSRNPLYVVDGVWFDDISFLSSNDIDNISILKDASAESIYGIRAANGVVLITTKKGRSGQATVNYNGYAGWQKVTDQIKMADATQYATIINELSLIGGSAPLFADNSIYGKGTDWYHQILRDALVTSHQVSVSGGADRSTYNFSLSYLDQDGIVEKNNFQRYTGRLQNDIQIFKSLKAGYTVTGAYSKSKDIPGGIFRQLYTAGPVVPVHYLDGIYGDPNDFKLGGGNNYNPQTTLDYFDQTSKNYRLTGNTYVELKFASHFTAKTSIGGEYGQGEVVGFTPIYTATLAQRSTRTSLNVSRAETRNWILENTLSYTNKIGDHNFTVLAGQSAQRYKFYSLSASVLDVPDKTEADHYITLGTDSTKRSNDAGDLSTIASYFGRLSYSFANRYLLSASIRADGSSKFTGSQRWGYFPSVGVGWVVSSEKFMQGQQIFDNLKLRGSWGKIGNASVPSNISTLRVTSFPLAVYGNTTGTSNSIASVVPPVTYWEKGVGTDVGLEAAFLKNKLYIEADYYLRKTENAIFDIPILGSLGMSSSRIIGNQATFQNKGFEFSATWKDVISKDLSYTISGNIGINDNKVLEVSTGANPIYGGGGGLTGGALATRTMAGRPIGEFYGYQVAGIFQNAAQIAGSSQKTAQPGDFIYVDQNKDGQISGLDRVPLGNPNPKYSYGINTNWTYKQFDLTLDFQGVAGVKVYNANLGWRYGNENYTLDFYNNRWHGEGTSNVYPSANIGGGTNYLPNSFYVEDGSYFRIRNMQLGYTISKSMLDRWRIKSLRVYANAQNAFNFFKYRGFSPELPAADNSPLNAGIDANVYPLYATYNFGINLNF
jgi:TonB-linked SusC/RagA family outer membrane protein